MEYPIGLLRLGPDTEAGHVYIIPTQLRKTRVGQTANFELAHLFNLGVDPGTGIQLGNGPGDGVGTAVADDGGNLELHRHGTVSRG